MRVIGGELGSRKLEAPRGWATRPTADRLRETLFNILGERVRGRWFVDAYAGSGAVGIEAWSRGARPVVWIEPARAALAALRGNLERLGIGAAAGAVVLERPATAGLRAAAGLPALRTAAGGYIFLDPPYQPAAAYPPLLEALARLPGLAQPAHELVLETRRGVELPPRCGPWRRTRVHPQGDSQLVFYGVEGETLC